MSEARRFLAVSVIFWGLALVVLRFTTGRHMTAPEFLINHWWAYPWIFPLLAVAWVLRADQ